VSLHEANAVLTDVTVRRLTDLTALIVNDRQAGPAACSLLDLVSLLASFTTPQEQRLITEYALDVLVTRTLH
jgi:hypothetical protein